MSSSEDVKAIWRIGVFDAHCHPTDIMASVDHIGQMKAKVLTVMSTRAQDQDLVAQAAERYPMNSKLDISTTSKQRFVVPAFGWHPWFSHQIFDDRNGSDIVDAVQHYKTVLTPVPDDRKFLESLPTPRPLTEYLRQTEDRLRRFPLAIVGEVGLDRGFRVPRGPESDPKEIVNRNSEPKKGDHTPGTREGRPLTPYRVSMEHQKMILLVQLELAAKLTRPVSVHSVQAHGVVFELLQSMWKGYERPSKRERKRQKDAANTNEAGASKDTNKISSPPYPPRICMHSYSGPLDTLRQFLALTIPADIYFSFSEAINFGSPASAKTADVIKAVPDDHILIESDMDCAGETMDRMLRDIILKVCDIKGWPLNEGTEKLKKNWERFIFGDKD